jgi:hypothetical protein
MWKSAGSVYNVTVDKVANRRDAAVFHICFQFCCHFVQLSGKSLNQSRPKMWYDII